MSTPNRQAFNEDNVNNNGIPFGKPDPSIQCAFFRVLNPRTANYKVFREDGVRGGLDKILMDTFGWGSIVNQQGLITSLFRKKALDTSDLDDISIASHKDLMWPYRAELATILLQSRKDDKGDIGLKDLFHIKKLTADKEKMRMTFASYNEIPLIFLYCGGDTKTGRVSCQGVVDFLNGVPPETTARISLVGVLKVIFMLTIGGNFMPFPVRSIGDLFGLVRMSIAILLSLTRIMHCFVLGGGQRAKLE
ncbi:predicted protein [Chaetoceros tenuissimus]|uniref:Uncharacterized protein n=1 Tax=Chaetoceros tenuissimus TaxID=426638 RepID=A0AAD3D8D7_9STRA|nr:predicted protein [Chaetoceros tenuissimus]